MSHIYLHGVRIDNLTMERALSLACERAGEPCWVVTPNALMLDACRKHPAYAELLNRASLSLPDGAGVLLAARHAKSPLRERVAGIDFGEGLMSLAEKEGMRVFLLGGKEGVAARAAERLRERYPRLHVCGCFWGYFEDSAEQSERLRYVLTQSKPDILLVCLGFPRQELWTAENLPYLTHVRVIANLGGTLDVWAGDVQRAPVPVQQLGGEWAWRMLHQPKRLAGLPALARIAFWRERE
ncbi:MAG: WecB/TagA/CpsF family glycosyltransferase [Clostridia bacterium]|nr:WecB/TagA/CpsF family glycosyltransferase [Clostridia bacterium]